MPIYEYRCDDCSHEFETLVRRASEAVQCPACGSEQLVKLISAHAIGSHHTPETACATPCSSAPPCSGGMCPGSLQ